MKTNFDGTKSPLIAIWETTQACDVASLNHGAQPEPDPLELSTQEAKKLIDEVAEMRPPIFVLTGADPLKRDDIYHLVQYAASLHLHPVLVLPATPLLTRDSIAALRHAGMSRMVLSLDGSNEELNDLACGVRGHWFTTPVAHQRKNRKRWRSRCADVACSAFNSQPGTSKHGPGEHACGF